jgi:hypothetical protein
MKVGRVIVIGCMLALLWAAPAAMADPCPPLDVACSIGELPPDAPTASDVADTIAPPVEEIERATAPAAGAVEAVVDAATNAVKEAERTLLPGDPTNEPAFATTGGGGSLPEGERGRTAGSGVGSSSSRPRAGARARPEVIADRSASLAASPLIGRSTTVVNAEENRSEAPSVIDRAIEGAKRLAFPLVLVFLVLAFLAIQDRIDRRSPKLAIAPPGRDLVTFE